MESILTVTDAAIEKAVMVRSREDEPERHALWVEAVGSGLQPGTTCTSSRSTRPRPMPTSRTTARIAVVIPAESVEALRGATLDRQGDLLTGGLVLHTPTPASPAMGAPPDALEGPVAERVHRVLEEQINPAIASHGGSAELVAVQEGVAYLRLGGGCVGCGMVAVTLTQGIESAILQMVPEVHSIVDVTDHAAGTNPYYEPAKK